MTDIKKWSDLLPGDTVVEHCGWKAVFVIAKVGSIQSVGHWDVVVLSSNHPMNAELIVYRTNWVRFGRGELIPPEHEVIRGGKTVLFPAKSG